MKKGYEGRIRNSGTQVVKAPAQQTRRGGGSVRKGDALREGGVIREKGKPAGASEGS